MQPLRPAAKVGIVAGGFVVALLVAGAAVAIRQRLTDTPEALASSGMHAFGDLVLGLAVFAGVAAVPLALGLYWLRSWAPFWTLLAVGAALLAATGPLALAVSSWLRGPAGNWAILADARIGLMPLTAPALLVCGLFAPRPRTRWVLLAAALLDGGIFAGVVLVKFVLPTLGR